MTDSTLVNGLALPAKLISLIERGKWAAPELHVLEQVFAYRPAEPPVLYTIDEMRVENRNWPDRTGLFYVCKPDSEHPPGDIEPRKSVIIGDLGVDSPIALDYRVSEQEPRVLFRNRIINRWVSVVPNITCLAIALGLED